MLGEIPNFGVWNSQEFPGLWHLDHHVSSFGAEPHALPPLLRWLGENSQPEMEQFGRIDWAFWMILVQKFCRMFSAWNIGMCWTFNQHFKGGNSSPPWGPNQEALGASGQRAASLSPSSQHLGPQGELTNKDRDLTNNSVENLGDSQRIHDILWKLIAPNLDWQVLRSVQNVYQWLSTSIIVMSI